MHDDTTTIELTSKRYKKQMVLSTLVFITGLILMILAGVGNAAGTLGAALMLIGACWGVAARLAAWWHHG